MHVTLHAYNEMFYVNTVLLAYYTLVVFVSLLVVTFPLLLLLYIHQYLARLGALPPSDHFFHMHVYRLRLDAFELQGSIWTRSRV